MGHQGAKSEHVSQWVIVLWKDTGQMSKLETRCQVMSFPMLKGSSDVLINLFNKKWASGFKFPLHYPASYAEGIHFTSLKYNSTPQNSAITAVGLWFHCSLASAKVFQTSLASGFSLKIYLKIKAATSIIAFSGS